MKIKITYDKGSFIAEREFENAENLRIVFDSGYVKIEKLGVLDCVFLVKAERFISAERIE